MPLYAVTVLRMTNDNTVLRALLAALAADGGAIVQCVDDPLIAASLSDQVALIVVDANRVRQGVLAIQQIHAARPNLPVVTVAVGIGESAVMALSLAGACDFVKTPFDVVELRMRTRNAVLRGHLATLDAKAGGRRTAAVALSAAAERCIDAAIDYGRDLLDGLLVPIGDAVRRRQPSVTLKTAKALVVDRFEREFLLRLIAVSSGNVTMAARMAGKHRRALFELLRKHGIDSAAFRRGSTLETDPEAAPNRLQVPDSSAPVPVPSVVRGDAAA